MNILILGGLGFLGNSVIESLSAESPRPSIFIASSRKEESRGSTIFVNYGNLQSVKNLFAKTNPDVILLEHEKNKRNAKFFLKFPSLDLIRKKIREFGCQVN